MALSPMYEYFAMVSQKAVDAKPPYRGKVEMLHFGDYILITNEDQREIQRRWFHKEHPIFFYYLPKEHRHPIVHDMWRSGCTMKEIADLIGLSVDTIRLDIKELKAAGQITDYSQQEARDMTPQDLILKSTVNQKRKVANNTNVSWA